MNNNSSIRKAEAELTHNLRKRRTVVRNDQRKDVVGAQLGDRSGVGYARKLQRYSTLLEEAERRAMVDVVIGSTIAGGAKNIHIKEPIIKDLVTALVGEIVKRTPIGGLQNAADTTRRRGSAIALGILNKHETENGTSRSTAPGESIQLDEAAPPDRTDNAFAADARRFGESLTNLDDGVGVANNAEGVIRGSKIHIDVVKLELLASTTTWAVVAAVITNTAIVAGIAAAERAKTTLA